MREIIALKAVLSTASKPFVGLLRTITAVLFHNLVAYQLRHVAETENNPFNFTNVSSGQAVKRLI